MKTVSAAVLLLVPLLSGQLLAHGGQYQRPTPVGPVTGVRPGDSTRFGGGTSPGPGLPGATRSGPLARKQRLITTDADWMTWWKFNGPALLQEYAGSGAERAGGMRAAASDWQPVRDLLTESLGETDSDIVDSALIARCRSASRRSADAAFQDIWPFVGHPDPALRRSAVFSMALLESDRATPVLLSMLNNTSRSDNVSCAMAAISLGYLSAPEAVTKLLRVAADEADLELRRAAVVSLGLFSTSQREIVIFLLEQLDRRSVPHEVRAAMPIALARLGDVAAPAVPTLRNLVHQTRTREALRRSSVIALGRLAPPDDIDSIETLIRTVNSDSDQVARSLALMSIGEIAARDKPSDGLSTKARERANQFLCRVVAGESARRDRAWACLAGARSHRADSCPPEEREALAEDLLKIVHYTREPSLRAAAVLALGILDARPAADTLREILQDRDSPLEAGFAALSLGLLGDRKDVSLLRGLVSRSTDPEGRDRAISGLALISRESAADLLVRMLDQAATTSETVWAARTLGQVGTPSSIPHLVRLAADKESPSLCRAFALVGLGRLLEPEGLPWNSRLATGANYLSLGEAETALLDIY